jgi:hypothetical protein
MKRPSPKSRNIVLESKWILNPLIQVVRETPAFIQFIDRRSYNPNIPGYEPRPQKEKKFLCIGGPFAGHKMAAIQITGYYAFNSADRFWPRYTYSTGSGLPQLDYKVRHSKIYIHESLL